MTTKNTITTSLTTHECVSIQSRAFGRNVLRPLTEHEQQERRKRQQEQGEQHEREQVPPRIAVV